MLYGADKTPTPSPARPHHCRGGLLPTILGGDIEKAWIGSLRAYLESQHGFLTPVAKPSQLTGDTAIQRGGAACA
ncbi:MAG: hypothetical protein IPL99_29760 [Candidatus Competibacteraceae bacterium]|nr:hypothetical protein [Candidatus Competibacteraceae bacterium]